MTVDAPSLAATAPPPARSPLWLRLNAILVYAFLYIPILILVIFSFNASKGPAVWRGFTLDWYRSLFSGGGALGLYGQGVENAAMDLQAAGVLLALRNSLIVSVSATIIATIIGTMIALAMHRYRFKSRGMWDVILYLPVVIPDITMGISLMVFFKLAFDLIESFSGFRAVPGFGTIIIAHVAFNISFVAIVVRARLAGMDRSVEEAAQDLGANQWQTFRRVTLPLIMPGILAGALLAFTLSLDDFVITFFTNGVGSSTLPIFVYGMIRFNVTPAINAISTLMLLASMVLVVASLVLQRQ